MTEHPVETARHHDLLLVGGGLANGLIALAVLDQQPDATVAIVEQAPRLAGNHTWCLHPADAPAEARRWLEPLICHRWQGYDVRFPGLTRRLSGEYACVTSARLAEVVHAAIAGRPGARLVLGQAAVEVGPHHVTLADGTRLEGELVVDARGPARAPAGPIDGVGFQKFLGLELELENAHGLERPLLMDATVPQTDGFRFFYVLPLSPRHLLVEDTTFSREPGLDDGRARREILDYSERFGRVAGVVRSERGVLAMPWHPPALPAATSPLSAGYGGGLFHPATGYSFPVALRLACHLARAGAADALGPTLANMLREHGKQSRYASLLNRLLFNWFQPRDMWRVFARFYRLPEPLIHRFYAMATTPFDRARILIGNPPRGLSLRAALGQRHALSRVP